MADNAQDKPQRTAADKDRSRQQSRAVSGKEAARTVGRNGRATSQQRPQKGGRGGRDNQQRSGGQAGGSAKGRSANARSTPTRPANQRSQARSSGRPAARRPQGGRSRTALFTWGAVAVVLVIVLIVVLVNVTSSPPKSTQVTPEPVPATILNEVTSISPSVYKAVGTGSTVSVTPPKVESGRPALTSNGKPELFYMGGEFCPYCAAERWAIIASLSRFGTFTGLKTMASSSSDVYPSTQTFTFDGATYTSSYLTAKLIEYYGQETSTGSRPVIGHLTKTQTKLVTKYDTGTTPTSSGSIPFVDIGNKAIISGASYSPQLLQGLTRAQIAGDLSTASNAVTKSIVGTSNYISAAICSINGGKPSSVCSTAGVQAAAKALGLSI